MSLEQRRNTKPRFYNLRNYIMQTFITLYTVIDYTWHQISKENKTKQPPSQSFGFQQIWQPTVLWPISLVFSNNVRLQKPYYKGAITNTILIHPQITVLFWRQLSENDTDYDDKNNDQRKKTVIAPGGREVADTRKCKPRRPKCLVPTLNLDERKEVRN